MNKLFLNNFPYSSQQLTAKNTIDPTKEINFIHGFDIGPFSRDVIRPRLASDILQALLLHDVISIELVAVGNLIETFGFSDTIKLLKSGCFEIIDHRGFTPVLIQDGANYCVALANDGAPENPAGYQNRIEKFLRRSYPTQTNEVNLILTQTEAHLKLLELKEADKTLIGELDYDLQNQNITTAQNITSKDNKKIVPSDIYKVLRLLFLNKNLLLGNSLNAVAIKVDGATKSLLQQKFSPLLQHGTTHDTISLFKKILEEKRIPDLSGLYLAGILSIEDVLLLRDNVHGEKFRQWYLTTHYDSAKIHELLLSKDIPQSILTKWLRFIIPNAIGVANAPLGILAGAVDSFIVDKIIGGWHPNIFLDDILKAEIDSRLNMHAQKTRRDSIKSRFPKVGRNDPCPCNSGMKFKKCCGN